MATTIADLNSIAAMINSGEIEQGVEFAKEFVRNKDDLEYLIQKIYHNNFEWRFYLSLFQSGAIWPSDLRYILHLYFIPVH